MSARKPLLSPMNASEKRRHAANFKGLATPLYSQHQTAEKNQEHASDNRASLQSHRSRFETTTAESRR